MEVVHFEVGHQRAACSMRAQWLVVIYEETTLIPAVREAFMIPLQ